ncbi:hypothetical protein BDR07DRAFT_1300251 [Suillus spraguei]|nr:hypothetical protein BDR07DRAFT_1300251 [Suillus spraguei]
MYKAPKKDSRSIMGTDRRPNPLRYVNIKEWDDGAYGDVSFKESQPDTLEEPWPYRFEIGDSVWIHSTGYDWYQGKISGQAKAARTKMGDGLFWPVTYGRNKRRYAAPLNGELKPDTPRVRKMLEEAGVL